MARMRVRKFVAISLHCIVIACGVGVSGQPTVRMSIQEAGDEGDLSRLQEGDKVVLVCESAGLTSEYSLVWMHETQVLASTDRVTLESVQLPSRDDVSRDQAVTLSITTVVGRDRGLYSCKIVRDHQGAVVSNVAHVALKVFSFPPEPSPSCVTNGPVVAFSGDAVTLNCTTSKGYPAVSLSIFSHDVVMSPEEFSTTETNDTITKSFILQVSPTHDGVVFNCVMFSSHYPDKLRACRIGPIRVGQRSTTANYPPRRSSAQPRLSDSPTTLPLSQLVEPQGCGEMTTERVPDLSADLCFPGPWSIAAITAASLLALSLAINLVCWKQNTAARIGHTEIEQVPSRGAFVENRRLNGIDNRRFVMEPLTEVSI